MSYLRTISQIGNFVFWLGGLLIRRLRWGRKVTQNKMYCNGGFVRSTALQNELYLRRRDNSCKNCEIAPTRGSNSRLSASHQNFGSHPLCTDDFGTGYLLVYHIYHSTQVATQPLLGSTNRLRFGIFVVTIDVKGTQQGSWAFSDLRESCNSASTQLL